MFVWWERIQMVFSLLGISCAPEDGHILKLSEHFRVLGTLQPLELDFRLQQVAHRWQQQKN